MNAREDIGEKGEGRREKGEGRREKGGGRREGDRRTVGRLAPEREESAGRGRGLNPF
jgi:hypothetical protein